MVFDDATFFTSPKMLLPAGKDRLAWKIGQLLVIGFEGGEKGLETLRNTVSETLAGNLVLFSRNTPDARETRIVVQSASDLIKEKTGIPPLVAIDQEGGIVARLKKGITPIPGAMAQSAAVLSGTIGFSDIEELGRICAQDLALLGVNWNLAPVADVNVNPSNPVIGVRSFGDDPEFVAVMASAFARGLAEGGVAATAKHFPGHGDTVLDSHRALPVVSHGMERLDAVELVPFKRLIAEGIPVIMTSHVKFPAVEPDEVPATLSTRVLTGLLRDKLGFEGVICTDCMEMDAIQNYFEDPYARALIAGADLVVVSHRADRQKAAAESIYAAVKDGRISEERIDASLERVFALKRRYVSENVNALGSSVNEHAKESIPEKISRASITAITSANDKAVYRKMLAGNGWVLIDVAPASATRAEDDDGEPSLKRALALRGSNAAVMRCPPELDATQIDAVSAFVASALAQGGRDAVALALDGAFLRPGRSELLVSCAKIAQRYSAAFRVLLMRSPYDAPKVMRLLKEQNLPAPEIFCAYEYSELSSASVAEFLLGRLEAAGKCPARLSLDTPGDTAGVDINGGKK